MAADSPGGSELDARYHEVYVAYAAKVRALARRRLQGRDVVDDVVQEVFLRLYRVLPELDLDRPVWPWLRTVCVNICTDVLRSPRTWAEEPVGELGDTPAAAEVDPVSLVVADEQRRAINDALAAVSPRQRDILLRRVIEGATSEEMADGEGTTVEAVKSAVKRGRQTFRRAYLDIAKERGLLGGAPAGAGVDAGGRLRDLAARGRVAYDACVRVCNSPAWQSVPVALSAAVLAIGWGMGGLGGAAPSSAGTQGRWSLGEAAPVGMLSAAAASTRSSSGATRPGGGAPPSSPPGQDRTGGKDGKKPEPLVRARTESDFNHEENWFRVGLHIYKPTLVGDGDGDTHITFDSTNECGEYNRAACEVAEANWPRMNHDVITIGEG